MALPVITFEISLNKIFNKHLNQSKLCQKF